MFLELHLYTSGTKILFNISNIKTICVESKITNIYAGEACYQVKESYEEVVAAINNYIYLPNA